MVIPSPPDLECVHPRLKPWTRDSLLILRRIRTDILKEALKPKRTTLQTDMTGKKKTSKKKKSPLSGMPPALLAKLPPAVRAAMERADK